MNGIGWFFARVLAGSLVSSAAIFLTVEWMLRGKKVVGSISSCRARCRAKQDHDFPIEAGQSTRRGKQSRMNGRSQKLMKHSTVPALRGL